MDASRYADRNHVLELIGVVEQAAATHARIVQLCRRLRAHPRAEEVRGHATLGDHPADDVPARSQALLAELRRYVEIARGYNLRQHRRQIGRQRMREIAEQAVDPHTVELFGWVRWLEEDRDLGVYAGFQRFAKSYLEECEAILQTMKEMAEELLALLSELDSEEQPER